jgi:hypothetical protein
MLQSAVPLMSGDMHAKLGAYYSTLQCHFTPAEARREDRARAREYAAAQHAQSRQVEAHGAPHIAAQREAARQRHRERMARR